MLDRLVDDLVAEPPGRPLVVVSDDRVAPLHGDRLVERLRDRGADVCLLTFPAGEQHKVRATKALLEDALFERQVGRDAAIVAVGGGVTGDLAGFVASTWHRGIPLVQVPTTLLAMVDAAIGGKTAVDLPFGKNLVGSFHQPWGVYADIDVLQTLDRERFIEGFAEVLKTAAVADAMLLGTLERDAAGLVGGDEALLEPVIARCMELKGRIVTRDEREGGQRAALNFGHTIAHALEAVSGFSLYHGFAVAQGMAVEARLARESIGLPAGDVERLDALLDAFGLPRRLPAGLDPAEIVEATRRDKKNRAGRVGYALPCRLGAMPAGEGVTRAIEPAQVIAILEGLQGAGPASVD